MILTFWTVLSSSLQIRFEKKRPSKLSELESQISKLQNDLSTVKEQLVVSESSRTEAEADAEDVKRKLDEVSLKLQDSQKQLSELDASKHAIVDQHDISQEEQEWESKIEAARQQQLTDISLPMHEITFSADDKPKLLSQLTSLLAEVGLNIQEAHAFSSTDGYSLDVFVVDGWPYEIVKMTVFRT